MMNNYDWADRLIRCYHAHKRAMPWRDDPTPYRVWISEMMLQQTQVSTVIPYFERFIDCFPDVVSLATATEQSVLKRWEGLGYYTRARNLHKAAIFIVNDLQGVLPDSFSSLQMLPGIGAYAAAAIASIAFNEPVPSVDGNFLRVFARFWEIKESVSSPSVKKDVFSTLQNVIAGVDPSSFNQGVMELGATLCKPKNPVCHACPLSADCLAYRHQTSTIFPIKEKSAKVPHVEVGAAIIWNEGRVLITRRPEGKMLAGLWEFPGGKQEPDESIQNTIIREIFEETALKIELISEIGVYRHAYSHFTIRLHAWHASSKNVQYLKAETPFKWVMINELEDYPFPAVDRKIICDLKKVDVQRIMET